MKKKLREAVGLLLLAGGVGGLFVGVHGLHGGDVYGGPAIGAAAVVNVLAYRVIRSTTRRTGDADVTDANGPQA